MSHDWYEETYQNEVRFALSVKERLFEGRSEFQHVEILDTATMGRVLVIDGVFMTSERDEFFYHEMLTHPALLLAAAPRDVLVIGGGDGGTVREVLRHPEVSSVVMVEIDSVVVEACKEHLASIGSAWTDPRLDLRIDDGIRFVKESPDARYDAVLLDGTDPVGPGEGLFNRAFYHEVRRVLRPGGIFALQSESPFLTVRLFRETQAILREEFPSVHPFFGPAPIYSAGVWSWTIAGESI
ncbi:MAG: polyamine aminopropyltransferase, partial [Myxococcota bacterium]